MTTNKPAQKSKTSPVPVPVGEVNPVNGDAVYASLVTGSAFPATFIVSSYLGGSTEPRDILKQLHKQADAVHQGDMAQVESMLMHQAVALQSMFADLASRAKKAQSLQTVQCLTQLALRSQAGCRNTLQTLAEVKNPRQVAFVKQTNVAQTQQVNNGVPPPSRVENINASPNELLVEEPHGRTKMDTRTKAKASRADSAVVAVDRVDRPAKRRR